MRGVGLQISSNDHVPPCQCNSVIDHLTVKLQLMNLATPGCAIAFYMFLVHNTPALDTASH